MWLWSKLTSAAWRDAWEERLHALAGTSLVITEIPGRPTLRLEAYCNREAAAKQLRHAFGGTVRAVKNRNWAALSVPKIEPLKIRQRLLIVSESEEAELARHRAAHPRREVISIPVEMAFGTGDHPTTATCLRLLCDLPLEGKSVLDLGCGTGILAIAARKLGAGRVLAVDFDPAAVQVARRNARRNAVGRMTIQRRDILEWSPDNGPYDLILANIFADVLSASFPKMKRLLAPGGLLILSGILDRSAPGVLEEGRRHGFGPVRVIQRGKWVTAVAELPAPATARESTRGGFGRRRARSAPK